MSALGETVEQIKADYSGRPVALVRLSELMERLGPDDFEDPIIELAEADVALPVEVVPVDETGRRSEDEDRWADAIVVFEFSPDVAAYIESAPASMADTELAADICHEYGVEAIER